MTKEDFVDWKNSPVTKQVFKMIEAKIEELKDRLVREVTYKEDNPEGTAGAIHALRDILEIDYEESNGN